MHTRFGLLAQVIVRDGMYAGFAGAFFRGGEYAMETRQVHSGFGQQGLQGKQFLALLPANGNTAGNGMFVYPLHRIDIQMLQAEEAAMLLRIHCENFAHERVKITRSSPDFFYKSGH